METYEYGKVDVYVYIFLFSAFVEDSRFTTRPLNPHEKDSNAHLIRWVGPRADINQIMK
jgi:hypothetical protein